MMMRPRGAVLPDWGLAAALAAFFIVGTYFASQRQPAGQQARPFDVGTVALLLVAASALAWRRRYPVAVLVVVFATVFVYLAIGYTNGPIWIALIVALFAAVLYGHRLAAATTVLLGFLVLLWIHVAIRGEPAPSTAQLAAGAAWLLVIFGAAELIRVRRERLDEAERSREGERRRRASEERLRIAQDLHDALGHQLSLISVQSGVALHLNDDLSDQTRASLVAIKQASTEALTELRSVLDILRQEGERAPRSPMSTLARLDDLVAQASTTGLRVHTEIGGRSRPLPFGTDVAAYRIVQESLTNVTKHAPGAEVTVHVTYGEDELLIEVEDDGRVGGDAMQPPEGGGRGIVGMRERAEALGGTLEVGPRPGGGFRVRCRLPLEGARATT